MSIFSRLFAVLLVCLAASSLGCNKEANAPTTADNGAAKKAAADAGSEEGAVVAAELAKLTPEERELVVVQKFCPVTSELLGSMGPPLKISVEGRDLYICCEGCKEPLEKDFAKYLAKFDEREAGDENPFD